MTYPFTHSTYFGKKRFYKGTEEIQFALYNNTTDDAAGIPVTTITGLAASGTANMTVGIWEPGAAAFYVKGVTVTQPANTLTRATGSNIYRLKLYGPDGLAADPTNGDADLRSIGIYGIFINPASADIFTPLFGWYEVVADFDIDFSAVYVYNTQGLDSIRTAMTFRRWDTKEAIPPSDTKLTSYVVRIRDDTILYTTINKGDAEVTDNNNVIFIDKSITGVPGGIVLNAEVTFTYNGVSYTKRFLVPTMFAA